MAIKGVMVRSLAQIDFVAREDRILVQLRLLLLEMERQLVIISAMIERLRRRWGLPVRQRRHKRYWVRPWITQAECEEEGQYTRLMPRLELDDHMAYRKFIQMPPKLEQRLTPELQSERTWMREPLSPGLKLAVTLKHLTSGDSYPTLQFTFRVARSTINKFVPEVSDAIIRAYRDQVLTCPTLPEDWLVVKSVFRQRWNILDALGALDGKHILIRCPQRGGSLYHNYKGFHSIVLPGPGGQRLQVPLGGCRGSRIKHRCSDFQALQFEAQNRGRHHWLP